MTRAKDDQLKRIPISLPREWHESLRQKAFDERVSIAELIRRAVGAQYQLPAPTEEKSTD